MSRSVKNLRGFRSLLMASVLTSLVWGASSLAAETCSFARWSGSVQTGEALLAALRSSEQPAYAGPCSLKVTLNEDEAYVIDNRPTDESTFNVRFYFLLDSVGADVTLFKALDGDNLSGSSVITATYDYSEDAVNVVFAHAGAGGTETVTIAPVASGWNSLEIQWESSATEVPTISLGNRATVEDFVTSGQIDTSGLTINSVGLGALSTPATVPDAGKIFFDDYDSRRDTVPGRLLVGDVNGDGFRRGGDITALINDLLGTSTAEGIPDCNEDGRVTGGDITCLINLLLDS